MTIPASVQGEDDYVKELYPNIAAVASVYGDTDGKYLNFLKNAYPGFMAEPFIFWNQPFALNETSGDATVGAQAKATNSRALSSKISTFSATAALFFSIGFFAFTL